MKNTYGNNIAVTLFGESHGPAVGVVIDGLPAGVLVSEEKIREQLSRRRPSLTTDTPRREKDEFKILSGVFGGCTCGTPVAIAIPNENVRSADYSYGPARPSHADYVAHVKYHGYEDYRGGGHFSARVTAGLVAAGGILLPLLESRGIRFATHIAACAGISDRAFNYSSPESEIELLKGRSFPVLDEAQGSLMQEKITEAAGEGDSCGGITETAVFGVPAGLGEPWFSGMDCELGKVLFSLGAVKGVEFGAGFSLAGMRGSSANDPFRIITCEGKKKVVTETNNNGGINGGITNGMPVVFRCVLKPTPSISKEQKTIDFVKEENINYSVNGRHDPAVVRRACPVIESAAAMVLCDMLAERFGTEYFAQENKCITV